VTVESSVFIGSPAEDKYTLVRNVSQYFFWLTFESYKVSCEAKPRARQSGVAFMRVDFGSRRP